MTDHYKRLGISALSVFANAFLILLITCQPVHGQGNEPSYGSEYALEVDGAEAVLTRDHPDINEELHPARTVDLWFKAVNVNDSTQVLWEEGAFGAGLNIYLHNGSLYAGVWGDDLTKGWISTADVQSGTWHHVAVVLNVKSPNDYLRGYLDGELFGTHIPNDGTLDTHQDDAGIGGDIQQFGSTRFDVIDQSSNPQGLEGVIDQLRLWNGALTKQEIQGRAPRTVDVRSFDPGSQRSDIGAVEDTLVLAHRFDTDNGQTPTSSYFGAVGKESRFDTLGTPEIAADPAPGFNVAEGGASATSGDSGAEIFVEAAAGDTLRVSHYGDKADSLVTGSVQGESFPSGVSRRVNVVWQIHPAGVSENFSTVEADSVAFDFSDINGVNEPSNVDLLHRDEPGEAWEVVTGQWTRDVPNQRFAKTGVSTFGQYAIGGTSQSLPVELAEFRGVQVQEGIRLSWTTTSETKNTGFQVQRRAVDTEQGWSDVGFVDAKGGTTTENTKYRFTDENLLHADRVAYRLKQVDLDGSANYSQEIVVDRQDVNRVRLLETAPNPVRKQVTVKFAVPKDVKGGATLHLYDVLGREVRAVRVRTASGRHERQVDVSGLPSGVYFLNLNAGNESATERLTVVR